MNKCYIIEGSTGEYSDRTNWIYRVYISKARAEARCKELNDALRELRLSYRHEDSISWDERRLLEKQFKEKEDPQFQCDYTGSDYTVIEADLEEQL